MNPTMNSTPRARIAVFASGNGSNAENIIRYFQNDSDIAEVALVVCNKKEAVVISRASSLGVPVEIVTRAQLNDPEFFLDLLRRYQIDFIALAGFLLIIPPFLTDAYNGRMVNIHPSLLPKYGGKGMYGHHIHEAVVAAGEKETGITIHSVSDDCDGGEILFQTKIAVEPGDTPADVEANIHALEKEHYPRVIAEIIRALREL